MLIKIALGNQKQLIRQPFTKFVAKRQHCAYLLSKHLLCMFYFLMTDSSSTGFAVRKSNFTLGKCKISKYKFANIFLTYINILNICHKFTSLKSRIALSCKKNCTV